MKANKKKEVVKMPRNLKKEYNWEKNKYYFIRARIPREMGEELKKKLAQDNKTMSELVREAVEKYLKP